jgi:hypothetical protein
MQSGSKRIFVALAVGVFLLAGLSQESWAQFSTTAGTEASWTSELWDPYRPPIYSILGQTRETGFRLGHGKFHTALGLLGTYDTNALYSDTDQKSDFVLQVVPGGDFIWRTARLNLTTTYRFTLRKDFMESVQDNKGHIAGLRADYQVSRRMMIGVSESYEMTSDPADIQIPGRLDRKTNEASIAMTYRTPGDDFDSVLRYTHVWRRYEGELQPISFFNNKVSMTSRINLSSRFRFLPKSVAYTTVEYGQTDFKNDPSQTIGNSDSRGVWTALGLTSQFTRKLSASLEAGFASLFFDLGPNAYTVTGGGAVNFHPTPLSSISLGYRRNVQVSTFTNYYKDHRFSLDGRWKFARRFEGYAKSQISLLNFSGLNIVPNGELRKDFVFEGVAGVSFQFTQWGKVRLEYQGDWRSSNATDPLFDTASADFVKHRINLGLDLYY